MNKPSFNTTNHQAKQAEEDLKECDDDEESDEERAKVNEELFRVAGLAGENLKKVSNCHVQ